MNRVAIVTGVWGFGQRDGKAVCCRWSSGSSYYMSAEWAQEVVQNIS